MTTRTRRRTTRDRRPDETTPDERAAYAATADLMRERIRRLAGPGQMPDAAFTLAVGRQRDAGDDWLAAWEHDR